MSGNDMQRPEYKIKADKKYSNNHAINQSAVCLFLFPIFIPTTTPQVIIRITSIAKSIY